MSNCIVCNDKDKVIKELLTDRDNYKNQLLDTRHELVQKDYTLENQCDVIKSLGKTLERYENENKHLRGLLRLWI